MLERLESESYETALPDERRRTMLRYVEKLTKTPARVTEEDVDSLRHAGFADEDILAVAEVAAYYAFVNRIADGLGVVLEDWFDENA